MATIIMVMALTTVGASAAELLAPEEFKPSTQIENIFQANKQIETDPYTPLKPDEQNSVVNFEECDLAIKFPKQLDNPSFPDQEFIPGQQNIKAFNDSLESDLANPEINNNQKLASVIILPEDTENQSQNFHYARFSCYQKSEDKEQILKITPDMQVTENYTTEDMIKEFGWFITQADLENLQKISATDFEEYILTYYMFDFEGKTYLIETYSFEDFEGSFKSGVFGQQYQLQFASLTQNEFDDEIVNLSDEEKLNLLPGQFSPAKPATEPSQKNETGQTRTFNGENIFYLSNDGIGGFYGFQVPYTNPNTGYIGLEVYPPESDKLADLNLAIKYDTTFGSGETFLFSEQRKFRIWAEAVEVVYPSGDTQWKITNLKDIQEVFDDVENNNTNFNNGSTCTSLGSDYVYSEELGRCVPADYFEVGKSKKDEKNSGEIEVVDLIPVTLYFTAYDNNNCEAVYPIQEYILKTPSVAKATSDLLFTSPNSYFYGFDQYKKSINIKGGILTIELDSSAKQDPKWGTLGTSCGKGYFQEIVQTMTQFDTVNQAYFIIDGEKQTFGLEEGSEFFGQEKE